MRRSNGCWLATAFAVGVACIAACSGARADTYRSGSYVFTIDGLSLDRVQDEVLNAVRLPLTLRGVSQVARWAETPCYKLGNARGAVGEATLSGVIAQLNARLPYRIEPCLGRVKPAITYFLIGNAIDPADWRALTQAALPQAQIDCDWRQTATDPATSLMTAAVVVVRSTATRTRRVSDCLMRNTTDALGVGWPTARLDPDAPTAEADAREINLLSLYIRYRITLELQNFKTLFQVEDRIAALVAEMHQAGTLAQSQ
ncbi:hypothetical protein [Dongia sp. agr-C8]